MMPKRRWAEREEQTDLLGSVDRRGGVPRNRRGRTMSHGLGGVIDWSVMFGDQLESSILNSSRSRRVGWGGCGTVGEPR